MSEVHLRNFDNSWYQPGRSKLWQLAWFFLGLPALRSALNPSSSVKVHLLRFFGASVGERNVIKPGVRVKYPWHLSVGNDCWIGEDCWIDNLTNVKLGNDVCVSQGVYFCTGNHDWTDPAFGLITSGISMEDGSWAGAKAVLAPGITIGICGIAAAGAVVTKNIPPYEIHAGNPCSFVKERRMQTLESAGIRSPKSRVAS